MPQAEWPEWVDLSQSVVATRPAGIGASRLLPCVPAKVD